MKTTDDMDFGRSDLDREPLINVYSKDEFDKRVGQVFNTIWEKLVMSFWPCWRWHVHRCPFFYPVYLLQYKRWLFHHEVSGVQHED